MNAQTLVRSNVRLASEAADRYARSLLAERVHTITDVPQALTAVEASLIITRLQGAPRRPRQTTAGTSVEAGKTYRATDGAVYRVQLSGSGNLYGKVWTPNGHTDAEGKARGGFVYAGGRLPAGLVEMTYAEITAFGILTGTCCVCCADLKDAVSVKLGIGPTCERNETGKARSTSEAYRAAVLAS